MYLTRQGTIKNKLLGCDGKPYSHSETTDCLCLTKCNAKGGTGCRGVGVHMMGIFFASCSLLHLMDGYHPLVPEIGQKSSCHPKFLIIGF